MTNYVHEGIQSFLDGRIWDRAQFPFPPDVVDEQIKMGHIQVVPGIIERRSIFHMKTYLCNRCHNDRSERFTTFPCAKCKGPCTYCRQCLKMGRVSSCTDLLLWTGPSLTFSQEHTNEWKGSLTPLQKKASKELLASTKNHRSHLIFAVCGAGKTEILFKPIHYLLQRGKRICIAAPRVDVILELTPRFQQAFPNTTMASLYGGSRSVNEGAQLVLATSHQLYRFHRAFDLVFVDEADAFPYTADESLQQAVRKAAKEQAPIHFVTATPTKELIAEATKNKAISTIPRRFHGFPLPEPTFESLWRYNDSIQKKRLPGKLANWIRKCIEKNRPFLLFFHDIERMNQALPLIQKIHPQIEAVHAAADNRKEFVQALRDEKLKGLLTTTILERGITIPNVQVAVVGAEQSIFTASALIQIGGRVGRSKDFPSGDFILFHHGISRAMDEARREIKWLNRQGGFQ